MQTIIHARPLGFFREFPLMRRDNPRLVDHIADEPGPDEEAIAAYLRKGTVLLDILGVEPDVLSPQEYHQAGYSDILTDGVWAWPASLPYYVATYHVRLPEEFLAHARQRHFIPPAEDEIDWDQLGV